MEQLPHPQVPSLDESRHKRPFVFISHDSRDAEVAELFSKLLSSVSAGVLKSFRSSDRKGNQGIEYGVEWYPEIMKKLESASDVVCLLTQNSIDRPWILYEAGVAKGKLDTPVHGLALGIPLHNASSGPFAQFQNCDDAEDSITQLVIQLVRRIPNAEPDRDVVKMQVEAFKKNIATQPKAPPTKQTKVEAGEASTAKIFEEIKVMFQDLPGRIERRVESGKMYASPRKRRLGPKMLEEIGGMISKDFGPSIFVLMVASIIRDDIPWLYELALDTYRKVDSSTPDSQDAVRKLLNAFDLTIHHPMFRDFLPQHPERRFELEEVFMYAVHTLGRF